MQGRSWEEAEWILHQQELIFFYLLCILDFRMLLKKGFHGYWKKKKAGGRLVYTAWFALSTLFCSTVTSSNLNWQAWGLRGSKFLRGSSSENMWLSMDSFMWTKNEAVRRHRIQENWVVHWLSVNLLKIHLPKGDSPKHQFPVNLFSENISAERSTCLIPWKLSNKYFRPDLRQFAATVS